MYFWVVEEICKDNIKMKNVNFKYMLTFYFQIHNKHIREISMLKIYITCRNIYFIFSIIWIFRTTVHISGGKNYQTHHIPMQVLLYKVGLYLETISRQLVSREHKGSQEKIEHRFVRDRIHNLWKEHHYGSKSQAISLLTGRYIITTQPAFRDENSSPNNPNHTNYQASSKNISESRLFLVAF